VESFLKVIFLAPNGAERKFLNNYTRIMTIMSHCTPFKRWIWAHAGFKKNGGKGNEWGHAALK
jgi:hypothetical protein